MDGLYSEGNWSNLYIFGKFTLTSNWKVGTEGGACMANKETEIKSFCGNPHEI